MSSCSENRLRLGQPVLPYSTVRARSGGQSFSRLNDDGDYCYSSIDSYLAAEKALLLGANCNFSPCDCGHNRRRHLPLADKSPHWVMDAGVRSHRSLVALSSACGDAGGGSAKRNGPFS